MESGNEEIGSSMQRIASDLLSNKEEAIETEFEVTLDDTCFVTLNYDGISRSDTAPGDFENLMELFVKQR